MYNRMVGLKKNNNNETLPERPLRVSKPKKYILIYERRQNQKRSGEQLSSGSKGGAIMACARLFHKCKINVHTFL